jgi:Holliday junction resolvasome RuvABC ATP-dependent DNA helicase subunit
VPSPILIPGQRFVEDVTATLADLSGRRAGDLEGDVATEALGIVAAVLQIDGRASDDEIAAWLELGAVLVGGSFIGTSIAEVRATGLLARSEVSVTSPSSLLQLMIDADQQRGSQRSWTYYERAMSLAHASAALDLLPSKDELALIDAMRANLLAAVKGTPPPSGSTPASPTAIGSTPPQPTAGVGAAATPSPSGPPVETPDPDEPVKSVDELLAELDELIGLHAVKTEVRQVAALIRVQQMRSEFGLPVLDTNRHIVFTGNPGTGKTTVARLVADIYRALGVVTTGQLVECDREDLVAGFVGQTAIKTTEVVKKAVGGLLLIDEAYALARGGGNDFGREAIDTLVKLMEDHRSDLVVIMAGYPAEMQVLLDTNPGLRSRFSKVIHFDDYTNDELVAIFERMGTKQRYVPNESAVDALRTILDDTERTQGFGNARLVRNLFEQAVVRHATRMVTLPSPPGPTEADLTALTAADVTSVSNDADPPTGPVDPTAE